MAYLNVLKGTSKGQKIPLNGVVKFVLGRNSDSHVVINDPAVSRVHARILFLQGRYLLEDGDGEIPSRNGTYLNSRRLDDKERVVLKNTDAIKICDFLCNFQDEDERKPLPAHLRPEQEEPEEETSSTVEATLGQSSQQILETQPAEILKVLLEITTNLAQTLQLDALLPKIVDSLFQVFRQADRGFVILREEGSETKLIPKVIKTRRVHDETSARFSRTIVNRCLQTNQALLYEDVTTGLKGDLSQSIADAKIRSVMCAPLLTRDGSRAFGVIQLDSQDRTKKFTQENLKLLVAVASQAAVALENARLHEYLLVQDRMQRDMEVARSVQLSFLPRKLPEIPGYAFFSHYEPALEVGGDYYDFIPLPQKRWDVMIGDVAGKGVAAALLMAKTRSDARFCMLSEEKLEAAVIQLNSLVCQAGLSDRFITLLAARLDPACHKVTLVSAGHLPPQLYRRASGTIQDAMPRELGGIPLGVVEGYPYDSHTITLEPGDCLLTFTDGVIDARNKLDVGFELEGVAAALAGGPYTPPKMGDRLIKAVKQHALGCKQHDDITIVAFGRT
jgi:serine phosphatase RsbU (regulator of sigma subunit)/pSer/pThr/pTyr-binding forkhead associated (FHA) protein